MKIFSKHTTTKGNKLEFYTTDNLGKNFIVVRDNSCQMERVYKIGETGILSWEDLDLPVSKRTLIKNNQQVINAWINEEINF